MAKQITVFDLLGELSYITIPVEETKYDGQNVFRKMLRRSSYSSIVEMDIAKCLMNNPQPNAVRVYDVVITDKECYIDMEQLEVHSFNWNHCILDVMKALGQLHSMKVVYIDIKIDNVGFSTKDGVYKLFDFNCSGIVADDGKHWLRTPFDQCFTYKKVKRYESFLTSLYKLDDMIIKEIADRLLEARGKKSAS